MFKKRDINKVPKFLASLARGINKGMDDVGEAALDTIDKEFERERTATGEDWAPLKPATIAKTGPDILQDTGDLRDSYEYEVSRTRRQVTVYSDNPVAHIHEFGAPDQNIPRRPVLEPAAEWAAEAGFASEFKPAVVDATDDVLGTTLTA